MTKNIDAINVHESYLRGMKKEDFYSGMDALVHAFRTLYTGMVRDPQNYAMKDDNDSKGFANNMNFLLLLAKTGNLANEILEIDGKLLAIALKEARVTKKESYFHILESLGFITAGLGKKVEASKIITIEYPDNNYLLAAFKAVADTIGMFSRSKPHQQYSNYFELLDYRVLENYPATEPITTMEYILAKINGESRCVVEMFYGFINPLTKCQIKGSVGHYWTLTFTLKSTNRVIMSLKINLESHDVKLNLLNLCKYTEVLDGFPNKMINEIKHGGWETDGEYAFVFDLDGKTYRKNPEGSFVFTKPSKNDSELLLGLLKKELEVIKM